MNESFLGRSGAVLTLAGLSLLALRCGGNSSEHGSPSSSGTAGAASGSAGSSSGQTGGSAGAGAAAGQSSAGRGGSSAGGRASSGGSGATGGSSGTSATTGGSSGSAGRGDAGGTGGSAGSGGDTTVGGAGGAEDECRMTKDCFAGSCWLALDGGKRCVPPLDVPPPSDCFMESDCCTADADCTEGASGRCIPRVDTELSCGGAFPAGNTCNYDTCVDDSDCVASQPSDTTVAACVVAGALGNYTARCAYGGCRTDADCTRESGGTCHYGLGATHNGQCDLRQVLFCAYPSDPCHDRSDCDGNQVCAPKDDWQGEECAAPPPMYP